MEGWRISKVAKGVPCSSGFIEADVILWNEGVWQRLRHRRGHAVNVGDRVVIAEVIGELQGIPGGRPCRAS